MSPFTRPYPTARCELCGQSVPSENLPEHLLADARILRIIKTTHPSWGRQECESYLRSLCAARDGSNPG